MRNGTLPGRKRILSFSTFKQSRSVIRTQIRTLAHSSDAEIQSARQFCLNTLRTYDTPSYLLQNYVPRRARDAYLAIRALNIDVARTADTTSTATIGAMRLQFQRDAVSAALEGTPPKQPVAILLAHAAEDLQVRTNGRSRFSKAWLLRLIGTREKYLSNRPYPDLAALESYAENTYSTLMYLTLQALPLNSTDMDHLASHIGKAAGIATVLRGLPLVAFPPGATKEPSNQLGDMSSSRQGSMMLPLDVMARHGVREEDVLRLGPKAPNIRDAVFEVATRANDHLLTMREMVKRFQAGQDGGHDFEHADEAEHVYVVPGGERKQQHNQGLEQAFGLFMPAVSTTLWLDRLQRADFDVFSPELRKTDWRLPFKAWWAYTRRRL